MQESEAKTHLTVYYRVGCHLCEEMTALLHEFQDELKFTFGLVDIDANAELTVRFNADVPVVAWGERILFRHFFDEAILRQALQHG
ncbi:glutaredoxin family protein [Thiothrix subterranea]|uniref:Glutaredoxin family protein n=2 Tax=Thiothrix subterranea TaxID=2735563 RepID=A0ABU0YBK1_9GAMM|nr:glutaredoxin family protein [Thiothrix subterranea]MDQ5770153.1 glutaredoxin family protein [Thiothrix subterranea]QQZ30184.1 glutaredoxin family protein [Thiothrix subterranea]